MTIQFHKEEKRKEFIEWAKTEDPELGLYFDEEDGQAGFETKWNRPVVPLIDLAKTYQFSFINEFEESGSELYGEGRYDHGSDSYFERVVDVEDFKRFSEGGSLYSDLDDKLKTLPWTKINDYNEL